MAKQEITLKGIDGQVDELVLTTSDESIEDNLEDCARLMFPQEGETVPRLRFKGFEGEWVEAALGELFSERVESNINGEMLSVTMNNGVIKASDNGRFDSSNSDKSHYKVVKVNDIAYNSMRMWQGASGCSEFEGIVSPAYTVVTPIDGIEPKFFACLFKTPQIIKKFRLHSQGLTSDTWNLKYPAFSKISVLYPKSIEEQRHIASFFSRLDAQMMLHQLQYERLKRLKSACLDSMFPNTSKNTPPIRFKGFIDEWKVVELSDCLMVCKERNINEIYGKADVLSVSDDFGVVNQIELLGRSFAGKSVANYRVLKHGDIVYTKSPLKIKPFGIIKVNYGKTGIVSTLYAVYTPKEGISTSFINYYFAPSHRMNSYIHPLVNKGAKNDMKVSDENVLKGTITIPSTFEEQVKIASFFCELDEKLAVHQQQLERLKQMKTACLRSMFPSNGGGILPLIRFKGFEGEWLIVKFSDMVQRISTYDNSSKLPSVEFEDIVAGEGVLNKDIYRKNVLKRGIRFEEHDVLFGKLRPYLKNILYANFKGIAVGDFWVLRALENIDPYFLYILVSSEAFMDVANISSGSKMPRADWNLVSNSIFAVPSSIAEQRRIASFFRSLDKKISLQSQQIEKLKQMKSACLYKMIA